jgi:hypothetical protein
MGGGLIDFNLTRRLQGIVKHKNFMLFYYFFHWIEFLCRSKNSSGVPKLSFACFICIAYVCGMNGCDQGVGFKESKGRVGDNIMQDGTVDLQHGTGVEGNSHLINQRPLPQVRVFCI